MKNDAKVKVLFVFANPLFTDPLRLDSEAREIRQSIERSLHRDTIRTEILQATTIRDLRRALLTEKFQVIHIAGHGSSSGILFANDQGGQYIVPPSALADLFKRYPSIECVILNACYSLPQGRLLSSSVPFTIAMDGPLTDSTAIAFSVGFYDALGAGHPIEFAYDEGISAIQTEVSPFVQYPVLMRKGEISVEKDEQAERWEAIKSSERSYLRAGKFLVGFAVDLSGSMGESIRNTANVDMSRLQSLDLSLDGLIANAHSSMQESQKRNIETFLDLFVYGFGLRSTAVSDLLSLIKAAREIITDDIRKRYKEKAEQEMQRKFKGYSGTAELLKKVGLGEIYSLGTGIAQQIGKDRVIRQLLRDMQPQIEARALAIGDTTLPFEEVAQMWGKSDITFDTAKEFIFGSTPTREVLQALVARFERELQKRDKETQSILFFISDGKFTDVDPLPFAQKLQSMGVKIVSCFVSNSDIANPRILHNTIDPQWSPEAQLMFAMSSIMGDLPEVRRYLLDHKWTIYPRPKLFVQLNHSDVLQEFVRVVLSILEDSEAAQALPQGW